MAQYAAFANGVKVNGETVLSVVEGMGAFREAALGILEKNGIKKPAPGQWYPQQAWLDSFKTIAETIGPNTLASIGKKIPENAKFPPNIKTVDAALQAIDVAYHMNHRDGEIGTYRYEAAGPSKAIVVCENPYPCDFDRGLVEAMARRFAPAGRAVVVTHEPGSCRKQGARSCTFKVNW